MEFQKTKRFFITRTKTDNIMVQGEVTYKNELNEKRIITKKNKKITMLLPLRIEHNKIMPNKKKITDVISLLTKHFGREWRELSNLQYYREVEDKGADSVENENEEHYDLCEPHFGEAGGHI